MQGWKSWITLAQVLKLKKSLWLTHIYPDLISWVFTLNLFGFRKYMPHCFNPSMTKLLPLESYAFIDSSFVHIWLTVYPLVASKHQSLKFCQPLFGYSTVRPFCNLHCANSLKFSFLYAYMYVFTLCTLVVVFSLQAVARQIARVSLFCPEFPSHWHSSL